MASYCGKYDKSHSHTLKAQKGLPFVLIVLAFFYVELFGFFFLSLTEKFTEDQLRPLVFGGLWAVLLGAFVYILPVKAARIAFGVLYFSAAVYAGFQTGYFLLFSQVLMRQIYLFIISRIFPGNFYVVSFAFPFGWMLCSALMLYHYLRMDWDKLLEKNK